MPLKTITVVNLWTEDLLRSIEQNGEYEFPNLRVGLHIKQVFGTSIASCQRSLLKLKLILSFLRSSMVQEKLSALALLSRYRQHIF